MTTPAATLPETARRWHLKERPSGSLIPAQHLELKTEALFPEGVVKAGKILVRITHIQVDPTNLLWISDSAANPTERMYLPPTQLGQPLMAGGVGEVVASWHPDFKAGEIVYSYFSWADYVLVDVDLNLQYRNPTLKVPAGVSGTNYITLALTGLTAYAGLFKVANATKETVKTLVVSAAAGATGSIVCQLARNVLGIERIVGIAGSEEKCEFLRNVLKVDVALNYNSPDYLEKFAEATPNYIDLYWDNVGGKTLQAALSRIAFKGKVIACGSISTYESPSETMAISASAYMTLAYQQASILGVIFTAFFDQIPELSAALLGHVMEGKVIPISHEVPVSLEDAPSGLDLIFKGKNVGKLVLRLPDI
ncbi:hypothetical protein DFH27DRAFT_638416 [Peziza echinospora]|nr:hypothetical protein DFH27DRAFT_638416 [Peziza echinospora]